MLLGVHKLLLVVHPVVLGVDRPSHFLPCSAKTPGSSGLMAFEQLKLTFTTAPILVHPDTMQAFILETEVSNLVIGAMLSQRHSSQQLLHPCAFYSSKLRPVEQNCGILDKEFLAIKAAFEEWHHYLKGAIYHVGVH